ncbi:MAG: FHA domain-containing protein [Vicinamibacterales bacterium]
MSTPSRWIQPPTNGTAIVFVHGVLSDGEVCWRSDTAYWPDLLKASPELAGTGIYVFSYKTSITSGNYSVSDAVDLLAERLRFDNLLDLSHLTFVCHSMGGIVARQFLVTRQLMLVQRGIRIGLFLVASPSLGSDYANLLSAVVALMGHSQGEALRFADDNIWLNDLDKNFKRLLDAGQPPVFGKELIEDVFVVKALWLKNAVVRPFSGARNFGDPLKIPDSTHTSIAKPESAEADQHKCLLQFLKDCRARAADAARLLPADTRIRIGRVVDGKVDDWRGFSSVHVTIGRGPENEVVVDDPKVSWEHGVVAVEMGVFVYRHLSRTNASTIASRGRTIRLTADGVTEAPLANQDRLTIGSSTLVLELLGAAQGTYVPTDKEPAV